MHRLFPPPPAAAPDELQGRTARCLIGAFTRGESRAAWKQLGLAFSAVRPSVFDRVRLLCVEHFDLAYSRWKA